MACLFSAVIPSSVRGSNPAALTGCPTADTGTFRPTDDPIVAGDEPQGNPSSACRRLICSTPWGGATSFGGAGPPVPLRFYAGPMTSKEYAMAVTQGSTVVAVFSS